MAKRLKSSSALAADLTIAWLNNPNVRANTEEVTTFLQSVHATLTGFDGGTASSARSEPSAAKSTEADASASSTAPATPGADAKSETPPAVTVRKSLASRDHILSMIDGKPYRTLKRHIGTHGLTPQQYRERFGLAADYPMVAPGYAEKRREIAKSIGLGSTTGRRGKAAPAAKPPATGAKPAKAAPKAAARKRGRPSKADAARKG